MENNDFDKFLKKREYSRCPNCQTKGNDINGNKNIWIHTCLKCGFKYCEECKNYFDKGCPRCSSREYVDYYKLKIDKIYKEAL